MEEIIAIPVILIVLGALWALRAIYLRAQAKSHWEINERTSGQGRYYVELAHPKQIPVIIAGLDPDSDHFEDDLENARSRAVSKAISMNTRRKLFK